MTNVNPIDAPSALLIKQMPDIYLRQWIYDPTWNDPSYAAYTGSRIVPAVGSIVQDVDKTPLWVTAIDPVTLYPSYTTIPLSTENDNVVSLINYGNSILRLYVDYRNPPYTATPDSKCVFIGKSPRFYSLTRFPRTSKETVISQYYDATGKLVSQFIPLKALDSTNSSWYLQRGSINTQLDENEEIEVKVFDENGTEVYSALLFAKESTVINENVLYSPTIVGMTVSANQRLANGKFFLYEKQDFSSLGLQVTLIYDDGTSVQVPIDGIKCILYGKEDFISSFSGLVQNISIKYFRSTNEAISPTIADSTGSIISVKVPIVVIPNTLGTTVKIMAMPSYDSSNARYMVRYFMYFGDGRSAIDVSGYVSIVSGNLVKDSSYFGVSQTYIVAVDMSQVDPTNYPTSAIYQQTIVITFGPPTQTVKWTIKDGTGSPFIYGQDVSTSKRPNIRFDRVRGQYFIPSYVFGNKQAFLNSFYSMASPPYDPSVSDIPQTPTHFVVRDLITGNMVVSAPIPIDNYSQPFNVIGDTTGLYLNATVIVEFLNILSLTNRNVLFGVPVDVSTGTYVTS